MDAIVYGDLRIEILAGHGGKIERTAQQATRKVQDDSRPSAPGAPGGVLGRDAETAAADAVRVGQPVEFHAACGFGKSTLLRLVADQWRARGRAPVVYLRAGGYKVGDLRHRLVETLYPANMPVKATPEQCVRLLARERQSCSTTWISAQPNLGRSWTTSPNAPLSPAAIGRFSDGGAGQ